MQDYIRHTILHIPDGTYLYHGYFHYKVSLCRNTAVLCRLQSRDVTTTRFPTQ